MDNAQHIGLAAGMGASVLIGCWLLVAVMRKRRQPARANRRP
ncbi:DedA family integral membrane protein [Bordetella pertussis]|nr:DedA family integral membrane protein [Bordetella pertussis]